MTATRPREIQFGERRYPVLLPNRRDPRLHLATVVISIHVIGITALGFRVSVPQILSAIVTAAVIDVGFMFALDRKVVWPASGMLTGSGVALILRLTGMGSHDFWSWDGWYVFAVVAGASVLTKWLIRYRGDHLFNPSNLGLVAAFLLFGPELIEPLDFWWAPLDVWMGLAYAVIITGGILITRRLRLLEMAVVYWLAFAAFSGVLAASGHCMTTAWALSPVCDWRFWTVLVTSPEILIFLFFMITDPKTSPRGRAARALFAGTLAILSVVLITPQTVEFGAKVALLGSLVVWSPIRSLFDRFAPDVDSSRSGVSNLVARLSGDRPTRSFSRGLAVGFALAVAGLGIVVLSAETPEAPIAEAMPPAIEVEVDPAALPHVEIDPEVFLLAGDFDEADADDLAVTLAENLLVEGEAIRDGDGALLGAVDSGDRLFDMQQVLDAALATGVRPVQEYDFDTLILRVEDAAGGQSGAAMAFDASGALDQVTYNAFGVEQSRSSGQFSSTFVLRRVGGDRWLIVEVRPG